MHLRMKSQSDTGGDWGTDQVFACGENLGIHYYIFYIQYYNTT